MDNYLQEEKPQQDTLMCLWARVDFKNRVIFPFTPSGPPEPEYILERSWTIYIFECFGCLNAKDTNVNGRGKGQRAGEQGKCENLEEYWPQHLPVGQSCTGGWTMFWCYLEGYFLFLNFPLGLNGLTLGYLSNLFELHF